MPVCNNSATLIIIHLQTFVDFIAAHKDNIHFSKACLSVSEFAFGKCNKKFVLWAVRKSERRSRIIIKVAEILYTYLNTFHTNEKVHPEGWT